MSKLEDTINMAEGARQAGNLDLCARITLDALREIEAGRARVTPEETGAVWEMWRKGVAVEVIAEKLGYALPRVKRIARQLKGTWGPR